MGAPALGKDPQATGRATAPLPRASFVSLACTGVRLGFRKSSRRRTCRSEKCLLPQRELKQGLKKSNVPPKSTLGARLATTSTFQSVAESLFHMSPTKLAILLSGSILQLVPSSAIAGEISSCQYLVIADFSNDPYGIANELRMQATTQGFIIASSPNQIRPNDRLKTCFVSSNWSLNGRGARIDMQVVDSSGSLMAKASAGATIWRNPNSTIRSAIAKTYAQLGYAGFDEDVYRQKLQEREYPSRPILAISEEAIKKSEPRNPVEGVWTDTEDRYRLGIVPASAGSGADYFAVILQSNSPLWHPGEIKAEIRSTATPEAFTCTYFMGDKKPVGTSLTLDRGSVLRGSAVSTPAGPLKLELVRVWPKVVEETASQGSVKGGVSGTGFLLSRGGLIATNWHVIADAGNISVAFPSWNESASAKVVLRDKVNDLAILRIADPTKVNAACAEFPFQLAPANRATLGERVSTVGYPLTPMLGANPKFAEGVVSSKTGFQDDPRSLQISAQVQPGSSGSPLFDSDGNIIGIVVATLDAGKVYQAASVIPQNVNFAIKVDYLLNLFAMLPTGDSLAPRTTAFSPEKASQCVALIRAW